MTSVKREELAKSRRENKQLCVERQIFAKARHAEALTNEGYILVMTVCDGSTETESVEVGGNPGGTLRLRCSHAVVMAAGFFAACFSSLSAADASEVDKRAIVQLENRWLDAHDPRVLDEILADDFLHPVASGVFLTKAQDISWLVHHPNTQTAVFRAIIHQANSAGHVQRSIVTDIFVKRDGRWQAISTQDTTIRR